MLKFVENAYLSMLEKEKKEKDELEQARRINESLKNKLKKLEEENSYLKEKFTKNEVDIIERKNNLNNLMETLQSERRVALEGSQRLQICKEQIDSIKNFIDELKPIKEQLSFKKSVTECLHDLLIKTKLRIAESEDILQELHDHLTHLEYDIENTREVHKRRVGQWQEEFLAARIREADVILEFDKLKRDMATIKNELEERKLIREAKSTVSPSYDKNLSKNSMGDKIIEMMLQEEQASIANTVELQNEIDFMRHQLRKLEDQKEDCEKRIRTNKEIKDQLHEVKRSIWLREFEKNQKTQNLKEKYKKLDDKMTQELRKIRSNIGDKDLTIARIEEQIIELQRLNVLLEDKIRHTEEENPADELEGRKSDLEKEIMRLKNT